MNSMSHDQGENIDIIAWNHECLLCDANFKSKPIILKNLSILHSNQ